MKIFIANKQENIGMFVAVLINILNFSQTGNKGSKFLSFFTKQSNNLNDKNKKMSKIHHLWISPAHCLDFIEILKTFFDNID